MSKIHAKANKWSVKILEPDHHRTVLSDMWTKILFRSYYLDYLINLCTLETSFQYYFCAAENQAQSLLV